MVYELYLNKTIILRKTYKMPSIVLGNQYVCYTYY